MKVRCTDSGNKIGITTGNTYEVLEERPTLYVILNDEKNVATLYKHRFEVVKEQLDATVNHPSHYTHGQYECIDVLKDITNDLSGIDAICTANAVKYLWRWKHKNGIEDLKKAAWYIDRLIEENSKEV